MNSRESETRLRSTAPPDAHEHGWCLESRHATSTGYVLYVRCGACGARRVDIQDRVDAPPEALSVELRSLG